MIARWLFLFLLMGATAQAADRPNIVWIVSEDNSVHYLRHFFPGGAETPNIEALASAGVTFDHAFSNSPVCSVAYEPLWLPAVTRQELAFSFTAVTCELTCQKG